MKIFHCDHCQQLVFFENTQCVSCGHVLAFLPDLLELGSLEVAGDQEAWYRLEVAKRRLVYNALSLRLPLKIKTDDAARGLAFEFVADPPSPEDPRALTGHANGVIIINVAEADDAQREKRPVGGLGGDLGPLPAHDRYARNRRRLRRVAEADAA
jgi:hypothetical protein